MNRNEFVEELCSRTSLTKSQATESMNAVLAILTERMAARDKVQFTGFGTFEAKYSPLRKARNPQTGEKVSIPAGYRPSFKAGKSLRGKVNEAQK
ncbi:HU family DNA-binding protein [Extibacter muris]|uniref:HU family DNA-binding protein n=1 Tax=Extibacter muris TaxID=1796622 RepID=A0A4R4FCL3_9FIRM|nr:HU family DNA-binding protein [Extibacter muris]MCU0080779.1 HU family DNA-binding protein [Extibacter muris]TDA21031.1 HU family DNA-binding protein [Extibacter muris]